HLSLSGLHQGRDPAGVSRKFVGDRHPDFDGQAGETRLLQVSGWTGGSDRIHLQHGWQQPLHDHRRSIRGAGHQYPSESDAATHHFLCSGSYFQGSQRRTGRIFHRARRHTFRNSNHSRCRHGADSRNRPFPEYVPSHGQHDRKRSSDAGSGALGGRIGQRNPEATLSPASLKVFRYAIGLQQRFREVPHRSLIHGDRCPECQRGSAELKRAGPKSLAAQCKKFGGEVQKVAASWIFHKKKCVRGCIFLDCFVESASTCVWSADAPSPSSSAEDSKTKICCSSPGETLCPPLPSLGTLLRLLSPNSFTESCCFRHCSRSPA